ncbi:response regulator transcription factor [Virgibacillus sp. LDC-1]|uniref:helix-turn-helix transcriptional regulator n=1 Tax=Virgibacillus sp. LDC-1 TaxID=3039856 RepID=UPI0024DEE354|nr:response regulator transcription factor [Virgibacillus sp. LDC-1]
MGNIVIINRYKTMAEGLVQVIERELPTFTCKLYDDTLQENLEQKSYQCNLAIIHEEYDGDVDGLISFFQENNVPIAVMMTDEKSENREKFFQMHLHGYLLLHMEKEEIMQSIKIMVQGNTYIHPLLSQRLLKDYRSTFQCKKQRPIGLLTRREWIILEEMALGYNSDEIALKHYISRHTVTNHVTSIKKKLKVKDRTNAILMAVKNKWVSL